VARLFITPREIDFINDINKEILKDVNGQTIFYFPISEIKTQVHDVYQESPEKIFENPVRIDAWVAWEPQDVRTNRFGQEEVSRIEALIPDRDMIQREISISAGDFFSYGTQFFEVVQVKNTHNIYGQIEHTGGLRLIGRESRKGNFISKIFGPTYEGYTDPDAVQDKFYQQRGFKQNQEGVTGDTRDLQRKSVLDEPISGPSEVSPRGTISGSAGSSFYEEQ
jgi:hypothetical protein